MANPRYAVMLDGGFVKKKLVDRLGVHPTADHIVEFCDELCGRPELADHSLLRIYWYDAFPSAESFPYPVSKTDFHAAQSERFRQSQALFDQLSLRPNFALRMGEVSVSPAKWRLKPSVARKLIAAPRPLTDEDFIIDAQQKGVDMRIGMDMARLALRNMVAQIIVVTGDSDFVPAFKFARREGMRVLLHMMGDGGRVELRRHADIVLR
jgi:uncharacterized LabA/DUF88 family protein